MRFCGLNRSAVLGWVIALVSPMSCLAAGQTVSQSFSGYVDLSSGHSLFVDYQAPRAGQDTLILINGLDNEEVDWQLFVNTFLASGYGILRYDPFGMGFTLAKAGPVTATIPMDSQVEDLNELTVKIGLTGKLNFLGHSYGGGMAIAFAGKHPDRVKSAILLCPYTQPLAAADAEIKSQIAAFRWMNPFNGSSDDQLYDYFLHLDDLTVFAQADPWMLTSPLKPQAVYELTQGIRKYNMPAASQHFPEKSVHLVISSADEFIAPDVLQSFWKQLPLKSRASLMTIQGAPHRVPQVFPVILALWAKQIMDQGADVLSGHKFLANPYLNSIKKL